MQLEITIEELRQLISVGNVGQHAMTENHWMKLVKQVNDENKELRKSVDYWKERYDESKTIYYKRTNVEDIVKENEQLKAYKIQVREMTKYTDDLISLKSLIDAINKLSQ